MSAKTIEGRRIFYYRYLTTGHIFNNVFYMHTTITSLYSLKTKNDAKANKRKTSGGLYSYLISTKITTKDRVTYLYRKWSTVYTNYFVQVKMKYIKKEVSSGLYLCKSFCWYNWPAATHAHSGYGVKKWVFLKLILCGNNVAFSGKLATVISNWTALASSTS